MITHRRFAFSALAILALLFVAFSIAPVRAAASDFLGLFRVQKFAPISISPQQLALLERVAEQGMQPGELRIDSEPSAPQAVATLQEAAAVSGAHVYSASALDEPSRLLVSGPGSGQLIVDLEAARGILSIAELDPNLLPDNLDGAAIDVTIYPAVHQRWQNGVTLLQTRSPLIDYPDDVNPSVLGQALLQMLGMSEREAQRLAASIDWSSTLLLPVPEEFATFNEVNVNGASALALNSLQGNENSLMWQRDGFVFVLTGPHDTATLQEIAASVR